MAGFFAIICLFLLGRGEYSEGREDPFPRRFPYDVQPHGRKCHRARTVDVEEGTVHTPYWAGRLCTPRIYTRRGYQGGILGDIPTLPTHHGRLEGSLPTMILSSWEAGRLSSQHDSSFSGRLEGSLLSMIPSLLGGWRALFSA